jgi:hypothetical protein
MAIRSSCFVVAMLAFVGLPEPAVSNTITQVVAFSASDFTAEPFSKAPPPYSDVSGQFTITYDPDIDVQNQIADISSFSLSIPYSGPILFTNYSPLDTVPTNEVDVGGNGVVQELSGNTNDFYLAFPSNPTLPFSEIAFSYTSALADGSYSAGLVGEQVTTITPTPDMPAWGSMLVGLGLVGGAVWWSRRKMPGAILEPAFSGLAARL